LSIKSPSLSPLIPSFTGIIVLVHVGALKKYVAPVEALMKTERGDETQFTTKIDGKTS
jgi:hypothetical protein